MTIAYKVLGQIAPASNTQTNIYVTPTGNSTVVSTITVCNQSTSGTTFCIAVQRSGAALSSQHYVNFNTPLPGNDTITLTLGITMGATDILSANSASGSVSFSAFGSEIY